MICFPLDGCEGNRHSIGAKTLNELRKKEQIVMEEKAKGISRADNTLYEQVQLYLSTKVTLAQSTRSNYEYYLEHSIKNAVIGKIKISDLKSSDILKFYAGLVQEEGYSAGTIKVLHKMIHPALDMAVKDRLVYNNVSEGCVKDYSVDGYHDFVFLSPKGTCLSLNAVRCMMSRLSRDSEQHAVSIRHVSPHICRHTYITELAAKGCDIKVLQALVGQKDLRVTYAVYNHLDNGRVYAEMQRLGLLKSS